MTEALAYWIAGRETAEIRSETLAELAAGDVRVRAIASGISRGTEALVFRGRVPAGQYAAMRCPFQAGDFPWPVKYGYASVGTVEQGDTALIGRRVFCLHPHQDRFVVPAAATIPVPEHVPSEVATLAANMETALNGLWDAPVRPGQRVAVVGAGLVGLFVAALASQVPGVRIQVIDPQPDRRHFASTLGLAAAAETEAVGGADLVFHTSGHPDGLVLALALAGFEATILELSWFGDWPVTLPLGAEFHSRRLTIRSSQVGAVAPAMRGRVSHDQRLAIALDLLADPRFASLIGERVPFADLPKAAARIHRAATTPPAVVVTYPS